MPATAIVTPAKIPWEKILSIRKERKAAAQKQIEGFESQEIFKLTVESKLNETLDRAKRDHKGKLTWWLNFQRCGREKVFVTCKGCGKCDERFYQCNLKWCPRCNWRITARRKELLELITRGLTNCKHVVLTQRNFDTLTREKIQESRANLLKLRRQKISSKIFGGCASLEFTNESRGWHMHWHLLLNVRFLDKQKLAIAWGKLVQQEFAIVAVLPVKEKSFLQEVCKYAVKGSELARWTPTQILQFVKALQGTRLFTVFGKFREARRYAQMTLNLEKPPPTPCKCGCEEKYYTPTKTAATFSFLRDYKPPVTVSAHTQYVASLTTS